MRNYDKYPIVIKNFDRFFGDNWYFITSSSVTFFGSLFWGIAKQEYLEGIAFSITALIFLVPVLFYNFNGSKNLIILREEYIEFVEDKKTKRIIKLSEIEEITRTFSAYAGSLGSRIGDCIAIFIFLYLLYIAIRSRDMLGICASFGLFFSALGSSVITKIIALKKVNSSIKNFKLFPSIQFAYPIEEGYHFQNTKAYFYYMIFFYNSSVYKEVRDYFIAKKNIDIENIKKSIS